MAGHEHAHRAGQHGRYRGAGGPVLGSADPALARELQDRQGAPAATPDPGPGSRQAVRGRGQPGARRSARRRVRSHPGGGAGGHRRAPGRALPAGGLADRQRYPEQHERQRGDRQPGGGADGRCTRRQPQRAPQRSRESLAVDQRRISERDPRRGRGGDQRTAAARTGAVARHPGGEGASVRRHRQDRAHPPPGCDAAHPWSGVLRLRRSAPDQRGRGPRRPAAGPRAADRRHRGRHRVEHQSRLRPEDDRGDRRAHRPCVRRGAQPLRLDGRQGRVGGGIGRAQDRGRRPEQDRQRRALARERTALRHRRDPHPRQRTGLLHHARQGQPRPSRRR